MTVRQAVEHFMWRVVYGHMTAGLFYVVVYITH